MNLSLVGDLWHTNSTALFRQAFLRDNLLMDSKELEKLAYLARLKIEPSERAGLTQSLQEVLHFIERLDFTENQTVEPLAHPLEVSQRLRSDQVDQADQSEQHQAIAPEIRNSFYIVPKVID